MRHGRRYVWGMAAVMLVVGLTFAAPAGASRSGCLSKAPGATSANSSSESGDAIVVRWHGQLWGCSFDRERLHKLPGQDEGGTILADTVKVERRRAAYGIDFGSNPRVTGLYSVKLRSGGVWVNSTDPRWKDINKWGEEVKLDKLVLRPNGSIAYQLAYPRRKPGGDGSFRVVLGFDHANGDARFNMYDDDTGAPRNQRIRRGSLDLFSVGRSWRISWRRFGNAAPIQREIN
ncbi:MAG TPA: hypothetical protein VJT75_11540 [Thermoleophilaceae bacterium]|nr:hypothetical protein [Thermoleophilaceae bacterium]